MFLGSAACNCARCANLVGVIIWLGWYCMRWGCAEQVHLIDTRAGREPVSPHKFVINTKWQAVKELDKTQRERGRVHLPSPYFSRSPFGCSISQEILLSLIYFSRGLSSSWIPPFLLHFLLDLFRLLFQFVWNLFFLDSLYSTLTSLSCVRWWLQKISTKS